LFRCVLYNNEVHRNYQAVTIRVYNILNNFLKSETKCVTINIVYIRGKKYQNNGLVYGFMSVMSWRTVLLVEETGAPGETTELPLVTDKFNRIMLHWVHLAWAGSELTTLMIICTECIDRCRFNCHTITMIFVCQAYLNWHEKDKHILHSDMDIKLSSISKQ
jgi:hypothetical protein